MTQDPSKLESLANVKPGTSNLIPLKDELRKQFLKMREGATYTDTDGNEWPVDAEYEFYSLFSGSDVDRYESFSLFGWGRFNLDLIPDAESEIDGSTTDPKVMRQLLLSSGWGDEFPDNPFAPNAQAVIELSEGFCWG